MRFASKPNGMGHYDSVCFKGVCSGRHLPAMGTTYLPLTSLRRMMESQIQADTYLILTSDEYGAAMSGSICRGPRTKVSVALIHAPIPCIAPHEGDRCSSEPSLGVPAFNSCLWTGESPCSTCKGPPAFYSPGGWSSVGPTLRDSRNKGVKSR